MTDWTRYDPELDTFVPCGGRLVACAMDGCENEALDIEVPDDPNGAVLCGACGRWIIAPEGVENGTLAEVPVPGGMAETPGDLLDPEAEAQT